MGRLGLTGFDANNKTVSRVADGSAATDAVNKGQLDAMARNMDWKPEAIAASTGSINLSAPGSSLDGVTLQTGDRFVAKDQSDGTQNGVYVWNGASTPASRAADADTGPRLSGSTITIQRGTVNADRVYRVLTDDPITVGTTPIAWGQVGVGYTPSDASTSTKGITRFADSTETATGTDGTIAVTPLGLASVLATRARKISFDCAATTNPQTFTHNLGTKDVQVAIREAGTDAFVDGDITAPSTAAVVVNFGGAPAAGQYRIIIQG